MSINKVILVGHLGRDPEVRYMTNGEAVANFSIATSETWNDRNSGNKIERTEWHNITLYRRLAEVAGQYLKKGSQVYIEGKIQSRKYTDKNGIERTAYDIIGNEMQMLGGRNSSASDSAYAQNPAPNYSETQTQPNYYNDTPPAPPSAPKPRPATPVAPISNIDDDIPF